MYQALRQAMLMARVALVAMGTNKGRTRSTTTK